MRRRPTGWKSRSRRSWRTTASAATVTRPARARASSCSTPAPPSSRAAEPPRVAEAVGSRTPVDRFLRARLAAEGLKPAPPAERRALIRRVYFDVTGLPPDPAEVEAFVYDSTANPQAAYERLVDRLL